VHDSQAKALILMAPREQFKRFLQIIGFTKLTMFIGFYKIFNKWMMQTKAV
jgi:hypothetical protein